MVFSETIYVNGSPVGVLRQNSNTRQIAFSPTDGQSRLLVNDWKSVDELKTAVMSAYKKNESPRD